MSAELRDGPAPTRLRRSLDFVTALLALWMFISPWVLAYGMGGSWSTWIASAIIFLVALSDLNSPSYRKEVVDLVLGAWLFISPWVLAFSNPSLGASWNQWLVGALIFLISAGAMAAQRNFETAGMRHAH